MPNFEYPVRGVNLRRHQPQPEKRQSARTLLRGLVAEDEDALAILQICQRAGVRVPKNPGSHYKPSDCNAASAIQAVIGRRGRCSAGIPSGPGASGSGTDHSHAYQGGRAPDDGGGVRRRHRGRRPHGHDRHDRGHRPKLKQNTSRRPHCCPMRKGLASICFPRCRKRKKAV